MKTYLTYGAINAVASALFMLVMFFLGFQTDKMASGQIFGWLALIIPIVILYLGMKDVRDANGDKGLSYGGAVFVAFMISLFASLFNSVYTYVHFTFVNPDFVQYASDLARTKMEAANVPSAQIDTAVAMQAKFMHPAIQAVFGIIFGPIVGTVLGLIIAIFVKRAPVDELKAEQPPVIQA